MQKKAKAVKRKILVILSNRLNRSQKPRFVELDCDNEGNIESEKSLRIEPKKADFDEVWENDEGRTSFSSAFRMKRKYGHPLQKKKTAS